MPQDKHSFVYEELQKTGLKKQITEALSSLHMDHGITEQKVNMFEHKIEQIINKLDELEAKITHLEKLLS